MTDQDLEELELGDRMSSRSKASRRFDPEEVPELLERIGRRGVEVAIGDDGVVRLRARRGRLTDRDRAQLRRRRWDLEAFFRFQRASLREQPGIRRYADGSMAIKHQPLGPRVVPLLSVTGYDDWLGT